MYAEKIRDGKLRKGSVSKKLGMERGTGDGKGDGVEFRRFFFHLFVVMKSHATSSQNRCAGCLASYHMQGYRTTKHF